MSSRQQHIHHCEQLLGKDKGHPEVHQWLDACFDPTTWSLTHRDQRHHKEGIEEIRKLYGDEAAQAALIHIMDDWGLSTQYEIPNNKAEARVLRMIKTGQAPGLKISDMFGAKDD